MVLAHCGLGTPVLYHRNGGYGLLARSVVVRPCLSARQHVHEVAVLYSPHRQIPPFVRTFGFRLLLVIVVFGSFGIGMYFAWGDLAAIGGVFWRMIVVTTLIGIVLSFVYAPMTWCSFCPIGSLAAWAAPKKSPLPKGFVGIRVDERCEATCQTCARVCPMQLKPYESRGKTEGYLHSDCFKCGKCAKACPHHAVGMRTYSYLPK